MTLNYNDGLHINQYTYWENDDDGNPVEFCAEYRFWPGDMTLFDSLDDPRVTHDEVEIVRVDREVTKGDWQTVPLDDIDVPELEQRILEEETDK